MPDSQDNRIQKLEESGAFTDRTVEQLSDEVLQLNRKLERMTTRLERLEAKLLRVEDDVREAMGGGGGDDDPLAEAPPHASGGPRHPTQG
ncbi:MAG: SlyX family protein [Planctomycetota bacterium]